jgi:hypothetical protein
VKKYTRHGIPDCFRGFVWQCFADVKSFQRTQKYTYEELKTEKLKLSEYTPAEKEIMKDLGRTLPQSTFFKEHNGLGQRSLFNVMSIFSSNYKETGYVQGMGFLTACLLNYMDEESAYGMLNQIMEKKEYNLKGIYKPGFPDLYPCFYKLLVLLKENNKKIYESLKNMKELEPTMYANQWFITLFFVNVRFELFVRIFDIYLLDGQKTIYRFGLALLELNEKKIIGAKVIDEIMEMSKSMDNGLNIEEVVTRACGYKISKRRLAELSEEYEQAKLNYNPNNPDEFLVQFNHVPVDEF